MTNDLEKLREEIARVLYTEEWKDEPPAALEGGDTYWHRQADRILALPQIADLLRMKAIQVGR